MCLKCEMHLRSSFEMKLKRPKTKQIYKLQVI